MASNMRFFTQDSTNSSRSGETKSMGDFQPFPVSVIIAGFCVMSAAYLICFCCCIVQFFLRRGRIPQNGQGLQRTGAVLQDQAHLKNDKLKEELWKKFRNSLRKFKKQKRPEVPSFKPTCAISCPICFEEYEDPSEVLVGYIKVCGHYFHFDCIWTWLESRQTCPICRESTQLTESDIKGIALRHVEEYQKACLVQQEVEKSEKRNMEDFKDYHVPGTSLEQGTEVTEHAQTSVEMSVESSKNMVKKETECLVKATELPGQGVSMTHSSESSTVNEITGTLTGDNYASKTSVLDKSSMQCKSSIGSVSVDKGLNRLNNSHDNQAFVSGEEV